MLTGPINLIGTFSLVPIFEWQRFQVVAPPPPKEDATHPGTAVDPAAQACEGTPGEPEAEHWEMRLVFKGFGWKPGLEYATWPRPDWMAGFASGAEAAADPLSQEHEARRAEANKPSPVRVHPPVNPPHAPTDAKPADGTHNASDDDR